MELMEIKKINDHIYLLNDSNETTGYLVIGSKKAILIDTMYGRTDLKALVESITSLPLMVVNTHGHIDHICGNACFKEPAFINKKDIPLAETFRDDPDMKKALKMHHCKELRWQYIEPGEEIDLGDLSLEVLAIPGHTPGSIGFLDRKDRILFSGDALVGHIWMQLEESLSLPELLDSLKSVEALRDTFDYILSGHCSDLVEATMLEELIGGVEEVIEGKTEKDIPYEYFGGICKAHLYSKNNANLMVVYNT